ncbi:MAG TPA: hypothetical protein VMM78_18700, partial [Thermomicrobiales bacterium]|nr:hypothetical protein [Thermomicrobiales bacterium]
MSNDNAGNTARWLRSQPVDWIAQHATWLALLGCVAVVCAIYGRALGFAFFFDDPFDLTRVEDRGYWTLLSSAEGYQYYRPVPALVWKLLYQLLGQHHQATLHAIPLVAHAVSGWLLYLLLRRLGTGHWALVPAVLFLTSPFHYQALAIVGPTAHVLAGAFILASLNLYLAARRELDPRANRRRQLAALAAACLALWSHESGVAVVPFIAGLEALSLWRQRDGRRPSPWVAAHAVAAVVFLIAWSTVDKLPSLERTNLAELRPKALFFLQGFTYPVSAQLVWIEDHFGASIGVLEAGAVAFLLVFAAFALAARRADQMGLLAIPLAGMAVAAVASLPSLLRLSWGYVENGPRLLYLVAIGSALFWGLLPSLKLGGRWLTLAWRVATLLLLCGIVAQSWRFIDVRLEMFERGTAMIDGVVAAGERYQGQGLLVVNAPSWFAQNRYEYRYGHFGVQLMPDYVGLDRVVYVNSGLASRVDVRSVAWQADVSGGAYPFGPHGFDAPPEELDALLREGRQLVTVTPRGGDYVVREVGRLRPGDAERLPGAAGRVGSGVWLNAARAAVTSAHPELLTIYVTWHALEPPGDELDTVIELRDGQGAVIARYEDYALDGMSAPRLWQAGDKLNDSVAFPLPPPGSYSVWAG